MLKSCDIGYQQRFRVCDNPRPMYGGVSCPGYSIETRMCYPNLCIGKFVRVVLEGNGHTFKGGNSVKKILPHQPVGVTLRRVDDIFERASRSRK